MLCSAVAEVIVSCLQKKFTQSSVEHLGLGIGSDGLYCFDRYWSLVSDRVIVSLNKTKMQWWSCSWRRETCLDTFKFSSITTKHISDVGELKLRPITVFKGVKFAVECFCFFSPKHYCKFKDIRGEVKKRGTAAPTLISSSQPATHSHTASLCAVSVCCGW